MYTNAVFTRYEQKYNNYALEYDELDIIHNLSKKDYENKIALITKLSTNNVQLDKYMQKFNELDQQTLAQSFLTNGLYAFNGPQKDTILYTITEL